VPSFHGQFSVDFTTNIAESNFRYTQVAMPSLEAIYMAYFDKIAARTMGVISIEAPSS
jgi:hypothetical protein